MKKTQINQNWLIENADLINIREVERRSGFKKGRIHDVKRGKANLSEKEIHSVGKSVQSLFK